MRLGIFRDFIARARGLGDVWLPTGEAIARHFMAAESAQANKPST
jgi:peptidoglycan-N-acetylglucosamine deacetylase